MTKLITKLILVLLPVIFLVILFELLGRAIPTSYSFKDNYINKKANDIEVLVLGSSHSNFGINPQYFGHEAFNISNTSQDLYYDYNILLKYLPKCKKTKIIIIPISYFTLFNCGLDSGIEAWRVNYYSVYLNIHNPKKSILDFTQYSALALWGGPLQVINGLIKNDNININEYGYQYKEQQQNTNDNITVEKCNATINRHHKGMGVKYLNSNIAFIDKISRLCLDNNIKIVFVTIPVYKTYSDLIDKTYYSIMTETIRYLSLKYGANSHNYLYDHRFEIKDFDDCDHLNTEGAKKFSIILKNEVIDKLI